MGIQREIIETELRATTSQAQSELAKLEGNTSDLIDKNKQLKLAMTKLEAEGKKNSDSWKNLNILYKQNSQQVSQNKAKMEVLRKELGVTSMTATQLRKQANELKKELNGMTKSVNPERWNELNKKLIEVQKQQEKVKVGSLNLKNSFGEQSGILGKLKNILPIAGFAALGSAIVSGTKRMVQFANETFNARKQMQKLTGESGRDLADMTAKVQASAKTFKKNFDELSVATNNFAKTMKIADKDAINLVNDGFIAGADASGEFLDNLREYGPQFKAAGLSAEESIAIMTTQVKEGIYSDKGADTIKEATLRLREMPEATQDALYGIGISSKKMMEQLRNGEITVFEAMQQVSTRLSELPPQSAEVGTAIADIFGGPGEDAGLEYIKMLGTVDLNMDNMKKNAGETATAQEKLLRANERLSASWSNFLGSRSDLFTRLQTNIKIFAANLTDLLAIPTAEKLREEQKEVNSLVIQYKDANTEQATKEKIEKRLLEIAPDVHKALTDETSGVEGLSKALDEYNSNMLMKILLAEKEAEKDKAEGKKDRRYEQFKKREAKLIEAMTESKEWFEKYGAEYTDKVDEILYSNTLNTLQKAEELDKIANKIEWGDTVVKTGNQTLHYAITQSKVYSELFNMEKENLQGVIDDIAALKEEYKRIVGEGIETDTENAESTEQTSGKPLFTPMTEEEKKAREKVLEDLNALEDEYLLKQLDRNEQEKRAITDKYNKLLEEAQKANSSKDVIDRINAQRQKELDYLTISQKQRADDEKQKLEEEHQEKVRAIREKYQIYDAAELQQMEMENLQIAYDEKLLSEDEFQQAKKAIQDKYRQIEAEEDEKIRKEKLDNIREYYTQSDALASQATNLFVSSQNLELAKLRSSYDEKIKAAGDNNTRKEKLEEEYVVKEKAIKKKQANAEFIITTAQIITNTALAVSKVWGQTGIAGVFAQALPIAMGVVQLGIANKQRQIAMQAYRGRYSVIGAEDGHTYSASYSGDPRSGIMNFGRPTLINERGGELILTADHTRNIQTLNPGLIDAIMSYRVPQRAEGNYTLTENNQTAISNTELLNRLEQNTLVINRLNNIISKGIKAKVLLSDLENAQSEMDNIRDYASGN